MKPIKLITDGYTVAVASIEDAMKAHAPAIKELFDYIRTQLKSSKKKG